MVEGLIIGTALVLISMWLIGKGWDWIIKHKGWAFSGKTRP